MRGSVEINFLKPGPVLVALTGVVVCSLLLGIGCKSQYDLFPELRLDDPTVNVDQVRLTARINLNDLEIGDIQGSGFIWWTEPSEVNEFESDPIDAATASFTGSLDSLGLETNYTFQAYIEVRNERILSSEKSSMTDGILVATSFGSTKKRTNDIYETVQLFGFVSGLRADAQLVDSFGHIWTTREMAIDPPVSQLEMTLEQVCDSCFTSSKPAIGAEPFSAKTFIDSVAFDITQFHYIRPYVVHNGNPEYGETIEIFIGNYWRNLGQLPKQLTNAASFVIGNKAYIVTGTQNPNFFGDFWTSLYYRGMIVCEQSGGTLICEETHSDIGVPPRIDAVAFELDGYGYIGSGRYDSTSILKDFWKYDPSADSWELSDSLALQAYDAVAFVLDDTAYVGGGNKGRFNDSDFQPLKDICIYSQGQWRGLDVKYPEAISSAVSWTIGGNAFIGTGHTTGSSPLTSTILTFDRVFDFQELPPFDAPQRQSAVAFAIGNRSYIGTGSSQEDGKEPSFNDFWVFDKDREELGWFQIENMGSDLVSNAVSFVLGEKAYVAGGLKKSNLPNPNASNDIWEYTPARN